MCMCLFFICFFPFSVFVCCLVSACLSVHLLFTFDAYTAHASSKTNKPSNKQVNMQTGNAKATASKDEGKTDKKPKLPSSSFCPGPCCREAGVGRCHISASGPQKSNEEGKGKVRKHEASISNQTYICQPSACDCSVDLSPQFKLNTLDVNLMGNSRKVGKGCHKGGLQNV